MQKWEGGGSIDERGGKWWEAGGLGGGYLS